MTSDPGELEVGLSWLRGKKGLKWQSAGPDGIAAWVADMDFRIPPAVRAALSAMIAGGDLGYPAWLHDAVPLREAFAERMAQRYGWSPAPGEVREFSDIIQALQAVLHVCTSPGDAVAMHLPAYPPFLETLAVMNRRLVEIPVERSAHGWEFDPERFALDAAASGVRTLILVNPHNPTGRVFSRPELESIAAVAESQDMLVISDEVHADLAFPQHVHMPFASISAGTSARTVTLTSATKAFNLAGIRCAVAHIGSLAIRRAFAAMPPLMFGAASVPGVIATLAAWRDGGPWLSAVLDRLDENRWIIDKALRPLGIGYLPPDATYLAWLDCRDLGLHRDPAEFFLDRAKVRLNPGPGFVRFRGITSAGQRADDVMCEGEKPRAERVVPHLQAGRAIGDGFVRLNFATSGAVLTEICDRMTAALDRG
jgi:cysteine-S-conjugate beta-lyase